MFLFSPKTLKENTKSYMILEIAKERGYDIDEILKYDITLSNTLIQMALL